VNNQRGRWIIGIVVAGIVVAFLGLSFAPLIGDTLQANKTTNRDQQQVSAVQNGTSSQSEQPSQEQLKSQERGYEAVLQKEPENENALRGLVDVRLQLGNLEGTVDPLQKLADLHPEEPSYSVLLAQTKQYLGDMEGAAGVYRKILNSRPAYVPALQGLTTLLLRTERPQAAIGLLQDTLKKAPQLEEVESGSVDVASIQLILGQVYASQERYDEAVAVYNDAISKDESDFRPVLAKALVFAEQGKVEQAKPLFSTAAELAPPKFKDQINAQLKQLEAQSKAQQSESPQSESPQSESPQSESPQSESPQSQAPQSEPPQSESPQSQAQQSEPPQSEPPQSQAQQSEPQQVSEEG
jgi:tetratricopeptide (TPR) repeat protein